MKHSKPKGGTSPAPAGNSVLAPPTAFSGRKLGRFLAIFSVCIAAGFVLLEMPFSRPVIDGFTVALAQISAFFVRAVGGQAVADHKVLLNPTSGFAITIEDTCNASNVVILLWAGILAFPSSWRDRAKGIMWGTLLLHAINLLRIVSLFYLGQYNRTWFEFAHVYLWEGVMMIVTLVVFWGWVDGVQEGVERV
jgi:exosortase H (IPTLxxWG-CTERM-specific)